MPAIHRRTYKMSFAPGVCIAKTPASALRQWHRMHLLGANPVSLAVDGRNVTDRALDMLRSWIAAGGAWNCSAMEPGDGAAVIDQVLGGIVPPVGSGSAGAGRWLSRAELNDFLANRGKFAQGEFWSR